jgi:hypothetical protein
MKVGDEVDAIVDAGVCRAEKIIPPRTFCNGHCKV